MFLISYLGPHWPRFRRLHPLPRQFDVLSHYNGADLILAQGTGLGPYGNGPTPFGKMAKDFEIFRVLPDAGRICAKHTVQVGGQFGMGRYGQRRNSAFATGSTDGVRHVGGAGSDSAGQEVAAFVHIEFDGDSSESKSGEFEIQKFSNT
jgi:hypothetical protein